MIGHQPVVRFLARGVAVVSFALAALGAEPAGIAFPPMPEDLWPELRTIMGSALKQSPEMLKKSIELLVAEGSSLRESAARWPSVASEASYGGNRAASADNNSSLTSTQSGFFYNVWASQPVYQWGTLKARAEIGKIGVKLAEHNYADAAQALVNNLRAQYLGLITNKAYLRNMRLALDQAKENLAVDEARLAAGQISPTELVPSQMRLRETQLQYDRAADASDRARRDFARLAGLASFDDSRLPETITAPPYDPALIGALVARFMHDGIERTREARNYQLAIRKADLEYHIARYTLYPKFSLGANVSQQVSTSVNNGVVTQGTVFSEQLRFSANWTIFDGFWTRGAKLSSLAAKRLAERGYQTYLEGKTDQACDAEKQLGFALREMELAEHRLLAADGLLKRFKEDGGLGLVSPRDVAARTADYYGHELNALNSRASVIRSWCEFLALLGIDPALDALPARFSSHAK